MKEFTNFLKPVNKLATESEGFAWRLTDEEGRSASYVELPFKDELVAINASIWKDYDALCNFVYSTVHGNFLRNKKKWFNLRGPSQFMMRWIPAGELPTLELKKQKLNNKKNNGIRQKHFQQSNCLMPLAILLKNRYHEYFRL